MKYTLWLISLLPIGSGYAQPSEDKVRFAGPVTAYATEKLNSQIPKGSNVTIQGVSLVAPDGQLQVVYNMTASDGNNIDVDPRKIKNLQFPIQADLESTWNRMLVSSGTYSSLLLNGYQHGYRNELDKEAAEYIQQIQRNNLMFNDEYLNDYLYGLLSLIHANTLSDGRPGNLTINVIKDAQPNAYCLPNGSLLISTGLLSTIQSEDELLSVLAHEVAHFVLDHQVLNYNKQIERIKKLEFWSTFGAALAVGIDSYLLTKTDSYVPYFTTTMAAAIIVSKEVQERLGTKYSQQQELDADLASAEILTKIGKNKSALAVALSRIRSYCILTGNYLALSSEGTHPDIGMRINNIGLPKDISMFEQPEYLRKVSFVNSYNAWLELWYSGHHSAAEALADKNINNKVATESDYIVKAVVLRRQSNTAESNQKALSLLKQAQSLNVVHSIVLSKEEAITYMRLNMKNEAKNKLNDYLKSLESVQLEQSKEGKQSTPQLSSEIEWTRKMIYKVELL